jgi:hypothetical protein
MDPVDPIKEIDNMVQLIYTQSKLKPKYAMYWNDELGEWVRIDSKGHIRIVKF